MLTTSAASARPSLENSDSRSSTAISKGRPRIAHLYVPATRVANVEHEVAYLNLSKRDADEMGWEQPRSELTPGTIEWS
jgi:hypothetical protein